MKIKLFFPLLVLIVIGCNSGTKKSTDTWIGGEIVNPTSDWVILSFQNKPYDTIRLDDRNFFQFQIENPKEGLYSIKHGEYQLFHLSPGDSLMLRVNTMDFDESISYSGIGEEKNNLLMDLFLINEEERKSMPEIYALPPEAFKQKIDSMHTRRMEFFEEAVKSKKVSKSAKKIALANINYDHYAKKELYLSAHSNHADLENEVIIPDGYFDYRKEVDFNDEDLVYYFSYTRFLNRYFDNLASVEKNDQRPERYTFDHTIKKIEKIDSLITIQDLKNRLLRTTARRYILGAKNHDKAQEILSLFNEHSTNDDDILALQKLAATTLKLTPGSEIPSISLVNTKNEDIKLKNRIKNKTVLYFWTTKSVKHYRDIHTKAAELKSKYPEYEFIGINTDSDFKKWKKVVERNEFSSSNEYQIENIKTAANKLAINSINKAMIISNDGTILNSNTSLNNINIETLLVGYLNQ